jgi:predicted metal-dependent HD superfamily phosphohydrolase
MVRWVEFCDEESKLSMMRPDFDGAREYVQDRLERELSPSLSYHNARHTLEDVLPAVERLGRLAMLEDEAQLLLSTAALFHDTGFLVAFDDHESQSIIIARHKLPALGYSPIQINSIVSIIGATRMPQRPVGRLQELICDADLDLLGRSDFWELNRDLLSETLHFSMNPPSEEAWLCGQLRFLETHHYFTHEARLLRDQGKAENTHRMLEAVHAFYAATAQTSEPCLPMSI